jgi:ABC-type uncharacterized transport system substrate-binding protein
MYRRAADYVDRLARGAKAAELPIEQPRNFELILNLKTAKAIGVTLPPRSCCAPTVIGPRATVHELTSDPSSAASLLR